MKKAVIAAAIAIYFLSISAVRPTLTANNHQSTNRTTPIANPETTRSRVANNGAESSSSNPTLNTHTKSMRPAWGNAPLASVSKRPLVVTANVEKTPVAITLLPMVVFSTIH